MSNPKVCMQDFVQPATGLWGIVGLHGFTGFHPALFKLNPAGILWLKGEIVLNKICIISPGFTWRYGN
jgi:hypothetical protein